METIEWRNEMLAVGTWDLTIKTPIGKQTAKVTIIETANGLQGVATNADGDVPLDAVLLDGDMLTWKMSITKPLRLNLAFEVTIEGDSMVGFSKAGRLPRSAVTGVRSMAPIV